MTETGDAVIARIEPIRRVDETRVVVELRSTMRYMDPAEIRANAEALQRVIRPLAIDGDAWEPKIEEQTTLICPACKWEWEIDPDDGLPACCEEAQSSWRASS